MGWNALADEAERPLDSRAFWAGRRRQRMTQTTVRKITELVRTTRRNAKKVKKMTGHRSPFAFSAAKYYPALKKLAEK